MARSLVQLETLWIWGCENIVEVIVSDEESNGGRRNAIIVTDMPNHVFGNRDYYNHDEKSQIEAETEYHHLVFQRLETLDLKELPSLKSFYSGNRVMSFPNLTCLSLANCPKIRRFSHGVIITSTSLTITVDNKLKILEKDLNTTIRKQLLEDDSDLGLRHLFVQEMDHDDDNEETLS
ncbi:uncharacterized protein LOC133781350 isoform X2 [Humulus lupulus]|uniref:uncharacterized protein LOC133781350 isoform X2 n=1 Tax=Humulus lupulus TaxID=3486 RepID=UPI002B40BA7A|nr:uncharacterized protein LOC133781350 isoform X2 [Humulus lupulus]